MTYHPLVNIATWRKGCSCATGHPSTCEECTEGLIVAIQKWFHEQVTAARTQDLAERIVSALLEDEKTEGFDLTAGMFGAAFSALVAELANQQATIQEMGELIDRQAAELETLRKLTSGKTYTHKTKGGYYRTLGSGKVAGSLKLSIGYTEFDVYMDVMTQQVYVREPGDFQTDMEPV